MLSINLDAATRDDVAKMAAELSEVATEREDWKSCASTYRKGMARLRDERDALKDRIAALEGAANDREQIISDAAKLIDSALGDGPDCDCPVEGHVWLAAVENKRKAMA